jgi:mono/diheme cytochrome c family protein
MAGQSLLLVAILALGTGPAYAQHYEAGKSGRELFVSNCSSCHPSSRKLSDGQSGRALYWFLSQHYTTSRAAAHELTTYLLSSNAGARRPQRVPGPAAAAAPPRPPARVPTR